MSGRRLLTDPAGAGVADGAGWIPVCVDDAEEAEGLGIRVGVQELVRVMGCDVDDVAGSDVEEVAAEACLAMAAEWNDDVLVRVLLERAETAGCDFEVADVEGV